VEVVGTGPTFYIPPSRFWVVPVLGRWRRPHPLTVNPWEVDEVLHVPLSQLLEQRRWRHAPLSLKGSTWAWQLDDDLLWGATAVVMGLLLDVAVEGWNGGLRPEDLGDELAVRPWEDAPAWVRRPRLEGDLPAVEQAAVTHVGADQVRALRTWLDERGVGPRSRAEQAARALTQAVRRLRGDELTDLTVTVLAGMSSNGAVGLAAARLLAAGGADVEVVTVGAPRFPEQTHVLRAAGLTVRALAPDGLTDEVAPGEVVIDAMLGVGAEPPLRDLPERAASWLRRHDVPVVAAELPSGLSADAGLRGPCVTADVTVAFGLPTVGLAGPDRPPLRRRPVPRRPRRAGDGVAGRRGGGGPAGAVRSGPAGAPDRGGAGDRCGHARPGRGARRPMIVEAMSRWCRGWDSNPHWTVFRTAASAVGLPRRVVIGRGGAPSTVPTGDVTTSVGGCQSVAVRAQQAEVVAEVVPSVAIDVVHLERYRSAFPGRPLAAGAPRWHPELLQPDAQAVPRPQRTPDEQVVIGARPSPPRVRPVVIPIDRVRGERAVGLLVGTGARSIPQQADRVGHRGRCGDRAAEGLLRVQRLRSS
jgi:hydroxyethylthiazole kinase-like uncharacterized protein yjeF